VLFGFDPSSKGQAQEVSSLIILWCLKANGVFLRVEGDKENIPSPGVAVTEECDRRLLLLPHEAQRNRKPKHSPTLTELSDNQDAPTVSLIFSLISMAFSVFLQARQASLLQLLLLSGFQQTTNLKYSV